jgi:hypothetical protein
MRTTIMRPAEIYGPGNPIPVGSTTFYETYVYRPGGDGFLPGTNIPKLRFVKLGARAVGAFADEVYALVEALRAARDSTPPRPPPFTREQVARGGCTSAAARRKAKPRLLRAHVGVR